MGKIFCSIALLSAATMGCTTADAKPEEFRNFGQITRHLCVRSLTQTADGMIWLAAEDGLYNFDGNHLTRHPLMQNGQERRGLGSYNKVEDCGDSLIVTCQKAHLSFTLSDYSFRVLDLVGDNYAGQQDEPICTLIDGDCIWTGTMHSLQQKEHGRTVKTWNLPVVKCIAKDRDGSILVGTDNGLFVISGGEVCRHILHDSSRSNSLSGNAVWSILSDRDGNIWLGTNGGLSMMPRNSLLKNFRLWDITGETIGNQLYVTLCDSRQRLWLGGTSGLICIDGDVTGMAHICRWYRMDDDRFPLPHNRIRAICELQPEHTILAGGDGGLLLYDEAAMQFRPLSVDGIESNWIYGIEQINEEGSNRLCITTHDATYMADLANGQIVPDAIAERLPEKSKSADATQWLKKYGLEDRYLSANEDTLNHRVLLGGIDEFAIVDKQLLSACKAPRLAITDIRMNGETMLPHSGQWKSSHFGLPCSTKVAEIFFTDFSYGNTLPLSYQYTLDDGHTWIACKEGTILLTNLRPGICDICLRPMHGEGSLRITLHIDAPWYATSWAFVLYALLAVLICMAILLTIKMRRRMQVQEAEHDALLASAKAKEKELMTENEHLTHMLHVQLLQSHRNDADATAGEQLTSDEQLLLKVTQVIEENICNDLDVTQLSKLTGTHPKQLYRKIKEMTGLTTVAYIRDLRLKKAATLLAKGGFSVAEVMYSVGFSNPSYFTRCFQERYGVAPSEYKG